MIPVDHAVDYSTVRAQKATETTARKARFRHLYFVGPVENVRGSMN